MYKHCRNACVPACLGLINTQDFAVGRKTFIFQMDICENIFWGKFLGERRCSGQRLKLINFK